MNQIAPEVLCKPQQAGDSVTVCGANCKMSERSRTADTHKRSVHMKLHKIYSVTVSKYLHWKSRDNFIWIQTTKKKTTQNKKPHKKQKKPQKIKRMIKLDIFGVVGFG